MSEQDKAREWLSLEYHSGQDFDFETVVDLLARYKVLSPAHFKLQVAQARVERRKAEQMDIQRLTCQNKTFRGNVYDTLNSAFVRAKEIGVRQVEPYFCSICKKYHVGKK